MTKTGQLWGGRFTEKPDETFAEFTDRVPKAEILAALEATS